MFLSLLFSRIARSYGLCALLAAILAPSNASAFTINQLFSVAPEGSVVSERRVVEPFTSIRLETTARVKIRQGDRASVMIQAEQNIASLIEVDVVGAVLTIRDAKRFASNNAAVILTVKNLTSLSTTGSVSVTLDGIRAKSLELAMGGSSVVSLSDVVSTKLTAALGGSSVLRAEGSTDVLSLSMGGSAVAQASRLIAAEAIVSVGGSSHATVSASDQLSISMGGSASVNYYGVPRPKIAPSGSAIASYRGAIPKQE